jgi:hypothetical protein
MGAAKATQMAIDGELAMAKMSDLAKLVVLHLLHSYSILGYLFDSE